MKVKSLRILLVGAAAGLLSLCPKTELLAAAVAIQDPAQQAAPPSQEAPPGPPQNTPLSEDQLRQLVAPIALYPDALVAQILAASAYPTQIVEAQRFVQAHPELKGKDLADEVDKQDWDPSVKALTAFPTVLANLDKNLSWTSELGDANFNQQADVMKAIQDMRHQAQKAGNLKTTPQQTVTDEGDNVEIQPAEPDVVYVPEYDPEFVYGYPVGLWPGFYPWWGVGGPYISFGLGFGIGPFLGFGWGWGGWGLDWHHWGLWYHGGPFTEASTGVSRLTVVATCAREASPTVELVVSQAHIRELLADLDAAAKPGDSRPGADPVSAEEDSTVVVGSTEAVVDAAKALLPFLGRSNCSND